MDGIKHSGRFAEMERLVNDYFNCHIAPIMSKTRTDLIRNQGEEMKEYSTSLGGILSMMASSAQPMSDPYQALKVTGEWNSKTTEDYIEMCKTEITGSEEMQQDLAYMAGQWRDTVVQEIGRARYNELSEQLGCDLAYAYMDHRIEELMIDRLVKERMPKSSADYIIRKAAESSLLGLSQTLSRSPLTDEIEARGEAAYRPNRWEKGTGWMLGTAADTLMMGGTGSLLGILGVFYFPLFYFSSVLLGLSAAWLVPANITVNFHEKTQGFINMDGKKYLFAAIWLFILYQAIGLPAPTQIAASFTIYTLFYVMAYHTVSHYPRYELDFKDIKRNLVATRELVLFLVFFGLLFLLRNARLLFDERLFDLAVYGFLVLFIVFVFVLGHQKKEWKLPSWLNLFTFLNGMLGNFLFLFSSFYVGILYGLEKLPFYMYFPYAAGLIAAKIVGPLILKRLSWSPLATQLLGLSSSLLVLLIPNGFAIGVFLLSFWHVVTGSWLNKEYYQTDVAIPMDRRIIAKYTTQNKGSVIHQFLLMTLLFILAKEMGEPIHLLLIMLNHGAVPIASAQLLILAKWINVGLLMSGLVTVYHLWKKAKKNEAIH